MVKKKDKQLDNKETLLVDDEFLKRCGRIFAHDLIRYQENGGDMKDISASKVYKLLEEAEKKGIDETN